MTPQQKKFLLNLIHSDFDYAHRQSIELPIGLGPFGQLLRKLEPNFTHQDYGHEKLLYLLRNEFPDMIHISKDQNAHPPRYYISPYLEPRPVKQLQAFRPEPAKVLAVLDPCLVDGALLERYLASLAESSARTQQRFEAIDRSLAGIQDELSKSHANEVRMHVQISELEAENKNIIKRNLSGIQNELEKIHGNEVRMNTEIFGLTTALREFKKR